MVGAYVQGAYIREVNWVPYLAKYIRVGEGWGWVGWGCSIYEEFINGILRDFNAIFPCNIANVVPYHKEI